MTYANVIFVFRLNKKIGKTLPKLNRSFFSTTGTEDLARIESVVFHQNWKKRNDRFQTWYFQLLPWSLSLYFSFPCFFSSNNDYEEKKLLYNGETGCASLHQKRDGMSSFHWVRLARRFL
jgi:hypothetical protein